MTFGSKPRGSRFVDWKSTLIPVIPAEAGIQAGFELEPKTNLDAGLRRHDELSLRLKATDFIPERDIKRTHELLTADSKRYEKL
jgi:hypothetical protein